MTKIETAFQAGTIDRDTALLYELYASLDYGSLPAEYQSANALTPNATTIMAELESRVTAMSAELRAKIAPFFLRPNDPDSFWQKRAATAGSAESITLAAFAAVIDYGYVDAKQTNVRVWYATPLGSSEQGLAQQLADEIDASRMWDREKTAMLGHEPCTDAAAPNNGGDGRLDIYLVYPSVGLDWGGRKDTLGYSNDKPNNGVDIADGPGAHCPVATHVIVNATLDFEHLKSSTAHELFHAFQFSFKNAVLPDRAWWMEATATWAKDLVYPLQDFEQDYLAGYWSDVTGAEGPIDNTDETAEYGAYILPFYLVQASGDPTGTAVGHLWEATESRPPLQAIGELSGWAEKFKQFALWNWNKTGVIKYVDATRPIPGKKLSQLTTCMDSKVTGAGNGTGAVDCLLKAGTTSVYVDLKATSVQYYEGTPDWPLVEKLRFDLGGLVGEAGVGIQAILTRGNGDFTVEDWSGLSERSFCVENDDLSKVVLVISNSGIGPTAKLNGKIKIDALGTGCSGWQGTMTGTSTWDAEGLKGKSTSTVTGLWQPYQSTDTFIEGCQGLPDPCVVYLPTGTIAWTWDSHIAPYCNESRHGTSPAGAINDPRNAGGANGVPLTTQSLVTQPDGAGHLTYWGRGVWDPGIRMKCADLHAGSDPPSYFEVGPDSTGSGAPDASGNTCAHTTWQIDSASDTIAGSCFYWNLTGSSYKFEWHLKRTGGKPAS